MKYKLEDKIKVMIEGVGRVDPFRDFELRGMTNRKKYRFTCGLLLPPWSNPLWYTTDIFWGNYEYEDPEDHGCIHYKHAELVIPDKNRGRGWLRIYTLEPEPEDFVQELDWEQLAALFSPSPK